MHSMLIRSYDDLEAWQKAIDLVVLVYDVTQTFPQDERFGLTNQVRRAAVSIPANIAEGQGRKHTAEFNHFLAIARGSLLETETHFAIALRLSYVTQEQFQSISALTQATGRLINGLIRALTARQIRQH
jgi:four helix bundle protein